MFPWQMKGWESFRSCALPRGGSWEAGATPGTCCSGEKQAGTSDVRWDKQLMGGSWDGAVCHKPGKGCSCPSSPVAAPGVGDGVVVSLTCLLQLLLAGASESLLSAVLWAACARSTGQDESCAWSDQVWGFLFPFFHC